MKFQWNSQEERNTKKKGWHLWFAWYPISVGLKDWRWMEWVERRGTFIPITPVTDAEFYTPWHWDWRWMEWVERRGTFIPITPVTDAESYTLWHWDYRVNI